jgi:hypothetical protein
LDEIKLLAVAAAKWTPIFRYQQLRSLLIVEIEHHNYTLREPSSRPLVLALTEPDEPWQNDEE